MDTIIKKRNLKLVTNHSSDLKLSSESRERVEKECIGNKEVNKYIRLIKNVNTR